jgi:hypothetical protein
MGDALVFQALYDQLGCATFGFCHDDETRPPAREPARPGWWSRA